MSKEREMAGKWLENHVHRSMWQIMTAADAQYAAHADTITEKSGPAALEELTRLQGKVMGIQEMVDLCLRAWLLDRQAGGVDVSLIWPEIEKLCSQDPVPSTAQARMNRAVREAATPDRQGRRLT